MSTSFSRLPTIHIYNLYVEKKVNEVLNLTKESSQSVKACKYNLCYGSGTIKG